MSIRINKLDILIVFNILLYLYVSSSAPISYLVSNITFDDTFYYLKPALNFWKFGFYTFDGINKTNGFQPLWEFILTGISFFIRNNITFLRVILFISGIFNVLSLYIMNKSLSILKIKNRIYLLIFLSIILFERHISFNGLETPLNFLLIICFIYISYEYYKDKISYKRYIVNLSFILPALLFNRLDNVFLLLFPLVIIFKKNKSFTWRSLLPYVFTSFLFLIYLIFNFYNFGHITPISGAAKVSLFNFQESVKDLSYSMLYILGWIIYSFTLKFIPFGLLKKIYFLIINNLSLFFGLFVLLIILWIGSIKNKITIKTVKSFFRDHIFWLYLLPFALFHSVYFSLELVGTSYYNSWHYTFEMIIIILTLFFIVSKYFEKNRFLRFSLLFLFFIFVLNTFLVSSTYSLYKCTSQERESCRRLSFIAEIESNNIIPSYSNVGSWNAGEFGFFLNNQRIINLDCLINNFECLRYKKKGTLNEYYRLKNIRFLLDYCDEDLAQIHPIIYKNHGFCLYKV